MRLGRRPFDGTTWETELPGELAPERTLALVSSAAIPLGPLALIAEA